ncbi:MAG TPA: hypothetical protein VKR61_16535 [Bryobacteraceae bacterium]|nr:hypothetical protein [Bryobacteraceae bacterium]
MLHGVGAALPQHARALQGYLRIERVRSSIRGESAFPGNHFGPADTRFLPAAARAAAHVNSKPIVNFMPLRRQYRTVALPISPWLGALR